MPLLVSFCLLLAACASRAGTAPAEPAAPAVTPTPTDVWLGLLERTPEPLTRPLPPAERAEIDGVYSKLDLSEPQWWRCLRCADYRPGGGIWKLSFDNGILRIYYDVTGWRSIASYSIEGDRLFIFNDPYCPEDVGEYRWQRDLKTLSLEVVSDACSINLRGQNLSQQAWESCQPWHDLIGTSDHWHKPRGCEDAEALIALTPAPDPGTLTVIVHPGDSRKYPVPPDVYVESNAASPPPGIAIAASLESIPYGLTRVLWGINDWIEATTGKPFAAIGVQFLGDPPTGWARVLFDGVEVWRGNTAAIWSYGGRHGGYVEISGFDPGAHTLRAESVGIDYHPVTVTAFGFSYEGGVQSEAP
ncbi:MAG: hypothetical protein HYZ26_02140 [Chloroflexi bacterium]|nr:hypothetical protein [Chloroflexota bacterium]